MAKTALVSASQNLLLMDREKIRALVKQLPPEQRAPWSKLAKAACAHLRAVKGDYSKAFDIAVGMMENWRLLGEKLPQLLQKGGKKQTRLIQLASLGVTDDESVRCQKIAEIPVKEFRIWIASVRDESKYTLPTLFCQAKVHVSHNSSEQEWYTPSVYVEAARDVLGGIDLDPASSEKAQETVKAGKWYGKQDNGLELDWFGRVWLNPPYASAEIESFLSRLRESFEAGTVKSAITLTNNATDTDWFFYTSKYASAMCLPHKRIRFLDAAGEPTGAPLQGQAFLYFGYESDKFCGRFNLFGSLWTKVG